MALSYTKLWNLLSERGLRKNELSKLSGISQSTMAKLTKGENVNTEVLEKICRVLECDIADIVTLSDKPTDCTENYKRIYDQKWNFKGGSMKALVHGLHPYPAMMMPLIARAMFKKYGKKKETVFLDPYVGSGTTLVEAQYYGAKKAIGVDLNPLAILLSRTKTEKIDLLKIENRIREFEEFLWREETVKPPEFSIRDSWFNPKTIQDLAKIRAFILTLTDGDEIDFFKTAFSEVVRNVSETRNGEFKLYRMSKAALKKFNPQAIQQFIEVIHRNFSILRSVRYRKNTEIQLLTEDTARLSEYPDLTGTVDLVITSPPYGDSHTTVAYGQFSRLSNEWLEFGDAATLDRRLLGGMKGQDRTFGIPELDAAIEEIKAKDLKFNRDRGWEVVSFYNDYEQSVEAVAQTVKQGGYVVYVVGNRRVRNVELPLDVITYKMFAKWGFEHIITHVRDILNKRMPNKASPPDAEGGQIATMTREYIVVMRKK